MYVGYLLLMYSSRAFNLEKAKETKTPDDNNHVTPTVKCETNHIKHCEINNGQSVDLNIVFAP